MNKDEFRAGFITGLAYRGYTPSEFEARLEKTSQIGWLGWALPSAVGAGALGFGLARLMGRGAGEALHTVVEPGQRDIGLAKMEEELDQYERLIEEAKIRAAEQGAQQLPSTV